MTDTAANTAVAPANPAGLGLVAFGLTTVLLSLVNAGLLPPAGAGVVIPLAIAFGGLMQIFAGVFEFRLGNTFGTVAFLSYGAFWWWFAGLLLLGQAGAIDLKAAGPTVGVALLLWGVFTFYMWIGTFRLPVILFAIFLTLWLTFLLLGLGDALGAPAIGRAGGFLGIVCGALAMYGSFGFTINATFGRDLVPLGRTPLLRR